MLWRITIRTCFLLSLCDSTTNCGEAWQNVGCYRSGRKYYNLGMGRCRRVDRGELASDNPLPDGLDPGAEGQRFVLPGWPGGCRGAERGCCVRGVRLGSGRGRAAPTTDGDGLR